MPTRARGPLSLRPKRLKAWMFAYPPRAVASTPRCGRASRIWTKCRACASGCAVRRRHLRCPMLAAAATPLGFRPERSEACRQAYPTRAAASTPPRRPAAPCWSSRASSPSAPWCRATIPTGASTPPTHMPRACSRATAPPSTRGEASPGRKPAPLAAERRSNRNRLSAAPLQRGGMGSQTTIVGPPLLRSSQANSSRASSPGVTAAAAGIRTVGGPRPQRWCPRRPDRQHRRGS
jgi:hypothetical protein